MVEAEAEEEQEEKEIPSKFVHVQNVDTQKIPREEFLVQKRNALSVV